mmetsp:Transcript_7192/g.21160  ORF Transcript_7192/g.21160 Transcript_7192/m.21160 type:complete len:94 (-) Transcript_7192:1680-1961(-)
MGGGAVASEVQKALHVGGVSVGRTLLLLLLLLVVVVVVLCRDLCLRSRHCRHLGMLVLGMLVLGVGLLGGGLLPLVGRLQGLLLNRLLLCALG